MSNAFERQAPLAQESPGDTTIGSTKTSLARNQFGVIAISCVVISAVAPISVTAAAMPVVFAQIGPATPAVYLIAGLLFGIFSIGYVSMSRHVKNAGGYVSYIAKAFGSRVATAAAYVTLLLYISSLVAFYAISGVVSAGTLGISTNPTTIIFIALAIVAVLCVLGGHVSIKLLVTLLACEAIALGALGIALLFKAQTLSFASFAPSAIFVPGVGVALLLAIICYSGLEATVVFSEEARTPETTIPRSVAASIISITLFYTVMAFALGNYTGLDAVQARAAADPAGFLFTIGREVLGDFYSRTLEILVLSSFLAVFVGFQSMIGRYIFALSRAGVLPSFLWTTNSHGNPVAALVAVTVIVGTLLALFTISGADLVLVVYGWLVGLGTVGLLCMLALVSAAIFAFFVKTGLEQRVWVAKVAPLISIGAFVIVLITAIINYSILGTQDERARWLLVLVPIAAVLGWIVSGYRQRQGKVIEYDASIESGQ
ncbi:APC family permease [Rhizobiales bacterium 3FA27D7]|jgi:amino acid transporter